MNLLKQIKEENENLYESIDKEAIAWISKNKKVLTKKFKEKFPKSKSLFVAQVKTNKGSLLINDLNDIYKKSSVSFLNFSDLKKLGCPIRK